jgi:hypothetical protein
LTPAVLATQWVAKILEDCGAIQPSPHIVMTDNENARLTVMNPLDVARIKRIDIR